jgi:cellulose synthase/poly-beta-1,6-N-acetylglucosamine synthase-like glycosyltransferase/spore germination protein YaaH/peptidoglycan/xylan/chitin deacetylase (PgdA/CDA1 family)
MSENRQVFHTTSRLRWNTFKWASRLVFFFLILIIPAAWLAMVMDKKPVLPGLSGELNEKVSRLSLVKGFSNREKRKYHGYGDLLKLKKQISNAREKAHFHSNNIRAAFYVDWDPQAFYSLENHIGSLNMVMPEWFFIDPNTDTIHTEIDQEAFALMKKHPVRVLPMLSNVNPLRHDGNFDGILLAKAINDPQKRSSLIHSLVSLLKKYDLQGINIDFEEVEEQSIEPMRRFVKELYASFHPLGLLVTQDITPDDEDFHLKELSEYNDYLFLMAYDQHYASSDAGPVSDQKWVEKTLDEVAREVPSSKIILGIAAYGYDWPDGGTATTITYPEAMSTAKEFKSPIDFDNDSYNCTYTYVDYKGVRHHAYFMDAAGNFNSMRFADQYGTAGVALWRLGAEDERLWRFFHRDLGNDDLKKEPFDFSTLATTTVTTEDPDYGMSEGEVLDVISEPQKGIIGIETDPAEQIISEQVYKQLPTRYVIRRFGKVNNEVVLTFDDGPDPNYTPRILDILEKEKVPAAFFVVGVNAEQHLPILKRIYNEGFEVGNHSFTHPNMATVSMSRAEMEMEATRLLIESATAHSTILFRVPYNADAEPRTAIELKPVARAKETSYYTVGESIDPEDWNVAHGVNEDSIFNRVVRQYEANPAKGIILLHDAGGDREATVKALPRIIHYFKSRGVHFSSIAKLLGGSRDEVMPAVHNEWVNLNGVISVFIYFLQKALYAIFWLAIILGLGRIVFLGIMAIIQGRHSKREAILLPNIFAGKVSIIVPAYNEELNAVRTIRNLLDQDYRDFEIIFVDDGSRDNTLQVVRTAFQNDERVVVLAKANGGKASALNLGIQKASAEFLVCIDADTQLMTNAVTEIMRYFHAADVVAVAGNVKVGNEKNMLTRWQSIEYTTAQNFDRRAFDLLNGITVVPGAIGAFRKTAMVQAGGFATDTLAEDCDLTIRLLRNGGRIRNCSSAIAVTEAPETLGQFMKQRFRWSYGIMQACWKNRDAWFNPRYRNLGMISLPNILLFQVLMPMVAPVADIIFFISIGLSWHDPESRAKLLAFYGLFLLVDVAVSIIAFIFEKERASKLVWLIPQRFVYRQLMYVVLFRSIRKAIKGEVQGWGVLKRTGNVRLKSA